MAISTLAMGFQFSSIFRLDNMLEGEKTPLYSIGRR